MMGFLSAMRSTKTKVQAATKAAKDAKAVDADEKPISTENDFLPPKPADDTILALDIGTENVKALIARQN